MFLITLSGTPSGYNPSFSSSSSSLYSWYRWISSFNGINGRIKKPRKLVIRLIRQSCLYLERSSAVTPTNRSLIQTPIIGEITLFARFVVPVKKAKMVPSIRLGVTFAKRAKVGSVFMARLMTPNIVSVRIIKTMSLRPMSVFNLKANAYDEQDEMIEQIVAQNITFLTSMSLRYYSQQTVPNIPVNWPITPSIEYQNLLILQVLSMK